jgi:hypothetical protein
MFLLCGRRTEASLKICLSALDLLDVLESSIAAAAAARYTMLRETNIESRLT